MAASVVSISLEVLQGIVAAIPGGIALWNAIIGLHTANPALTSAQTQTLMTSVFGVITTVGADEVSQLALIPPVPVAGAPVAPAATAATKVAP
jgi:hypothetical protein